jgi:predicted transcriptional regulator
MSNVNKLELVANVAASYLRRNSVSVEQIGSVVSNITRAIEHAAKELNGGEVAAEAPTSPASQTPAVSVKKSVQRDFIVCLEDGFKAKTLKRHLRDAHGLTPQEYRAKWNLPRDYPIVAPSYSERRSQMAKQLGLGKKMAEGRASKGRKPRRRRAAA